MVMNSRGGPPFLGCMLMNSRGGPPILRGSPPLGTISMDHTVHCKLKECLLKTQAHENQNSSTEMIPSHQFCEWAKNSSARTRIILQTSRFELLVIDCTFHIVHPHKLVSYHECDFSRLQNTAKSFENNVQRARCRYKEDSLA